MEFQICESRKNNTKTAVNVKTVTRSNNTNNKVKSNTAEEEKHKGFIATLKDSFGFIETANHDKEVFFHFRYQIFYVLCITNLGYAIIL